MVVFELCLLLFILLALVACKKDYSYEKKKTCGIVTDKYLVNNTTPYFEIGESAIGDGVRLQVSETDYNSHKIGDWYCY